jgi:4-amino-4-deoxy-L-arabinose transferase-like glycosyltransferase
MDGELSGCPLSLIIPAYNEEAGIALAIAEADAALRQLGHPYEILIVDDGSRDATAAIVLAAARERPNVRLLRHETNRGYGAALRTGFQAARGARIAFTDADCQFDLSELAQLLPLTESHALALGYRARRQDPWLRKFYSRGYNLLARTLLGTGVRDVDCALKVFRREALGRLLPDSSGFFVNTEMVTRARQLGLSIAESAVTHRQRFHGQSKVSWHDIPRTLNALLPFWWTRVLFAGAPRATHSPGAPVQLALFAVLLLMAGALFLSRLGQPLLEPEEARYAEIPRQMLAEGRWLTPVLHGEAYYQKPPLLYWLVMAVYRGLGVHDWVARLVPALAGVATVLVTTLWGWRCLGFWTGLFSGAIVCLSGRFLYLGGMLAMDGLLGLCVVAGLACGHLGMTEERGRGRWLALSALCCGLGILTKGPVALILIFGPLPLFAFLDRRGPAWRWPHYFLYLALTLLVAGPWYGAVAWTDPGAAGEFFWRHNLLRYVAPFDHEEPVWFYGPSLLLGALPWTLLLVPLASYLRRRSARAGRRRPAALGFFGLALALCLVFFSLSGCKRPGYILPAFPLLALILGTFLTHGLPRRFWMPSHGKQRLLWGGGTAGLFILLLLGIREGLPRYHNRYVLRQQVRAQLDVAQDGKTPIICYPKRWDSISFYLGRAVGVYTPLQKEALVLELQTQGRALLFVRRGGALQELLHALPEGWEFSPRGAQGQNVATGIVQARP